MACTNTLSSLWDFYTLYTTKLRNRLARPLHQLKGQTPYEMLTGNTPDISEFLGYESYQPVWYFEPTTIPNQCNILARWIGIAHRVGQAMCYWLLPQSGIPITRTTIQPVSEEELQTDAIKEQIKAFDTLLGDKITSLTDNPNVKMQLYHGDEDIKDDIIHEEETEQNNADAEPELDMHDELLLSEPTLQTMNGPLKAKIIARKRDQDGTLIGTFNPNPVLNTRIYIAEFQDGSTKDYAANIIAEAIYDQVTEDGYDYEYDDATDLIPKDSEERHFKTMMNNWKICLSWKDESSS
jgi:hypothetical protein